MREGCEEFQRGKTFQGTGEGERSLEEDGRRAGTRHRHP